MEKECREYAQRVAAEIEAIYNGRRFDCPGPNYRAGFSTLVITGISSL